MQIWLIWHVMVWADGSSWLDGRWWIRSIVATSMLFSLLTWVQISYIVGGWWWYSPLWLHHAQMMIFITNDNVDDCRVSYKWCRPFLGRTDGRTEKWTDERTDERTDGRTDTPFFFFFSLKQSHSCLVATSEDEI